MTNRPRQVFFGDISQARGFVSLPVAGLDISGNPRVFGGGVVGGVVSAASPFLFDNLCKVWVKIQGRDATPLKPTKQKGFIMPLDLTTINQPVTEIRDGLEYKHSDPNDLSLFTDRAVFERVPTLADIDGLPEAMNGYDAIFNRATGQLVDMRPIAKSYQLVPHQDMLAAQSRQLADSQLAGQRVQVVDRLFEAGKKAHRTIYFQDMKADVKSRAGSDSVVPRLDVFNSIDMSWAFQVFSGAYRDLCRNTLVFGGQKAYHQKKKHTRNLDTASLTGKAMLSLDMFTNQRELMDSWAATGLSERQFRDILEGSICQRPARPSDTEEKETVNKGLLDYLLYQYREETEELGETLWAGYNALTHWATHTLETPRAKKTQKSHDVTRQRNDRVRDVLASDAWQVLEGVAA